MDYIEVTIQTTHQAADLLADLLAEIAGGSQVDDPQTIDDFVNSPVKRWDYIEEQLFDNPQRLPTVRCFLTPDDQGAQKLKEIGQLLAGLKQEDQTGFYGSLNIEVSSVHSQDWENEWKRYYKPFTVGNRLYVCPSWESAELPAGRVLLTMDPASSFGTGSHATTQMCMEQLDQLDLAGAKILDVGCGSGILSCTALLLGASTAMACDIEENAMTITRENMKKNKLESSRFQVRQGDLLSDQNLAGQLKQAGPYQVIVANIVADVLIAMADQLPHWLSPGGRLILSGIIDTREAEVRRRYEQAGLEIINRLTKDGWVMLCCRFPLDLEKNS